MKKLTKQKEKKYIEAEELVILDRELDLSEREFVLDHWKASGRNMVNQTGAFFTPKSIAKELVTFGVDDTKPQVILDLCAGIGRLAFEAMHRFNITVDRIVCVELNEEYVRVGKKILPEAEWYCADIFHEDFWEQFSPYSFTVVLSNPPFTRIPKKRMPAEYDWLDYKGLTDLMAAEVALRVCPEASFILPAQHVPFAYASNRENPFEHKKTSSKEYSKWKSGGYGEISLLIASEFDLVSFDKASLAIELCDVRRY